MLFNRRKIAQEKAARQNAERAAFIQEFQDMFNEVGGRWLFMVLEYSPKGSPLNPDQYAALKRLWRESDILIGYPFPIVAIGKEIRWETHTKMTLPMWLAAFLQCRLGVRMPHEMIEGFTRDFIIDG